jgi:flagellar biosynthetic protein FliR
MLVGAAMGFSMRLVFAAIEYAGELASSTMGFSFASFFDPTTQGRSAAISQFLSMVATMAFLAVNAHLVLLAALSESFVSLPISSTPLSLAAPLELARLGSRIFSAGLQISLPIIAALLITNVALGILTRAAPQLNIFGIGFPITLAVRAPAQRRHRDRAEDPAHDAGRAVPARAETGPVAPQGGKAARSAPYPTLMNRRRVEWWDTPVGLRPRFPTHARR